METYVKIIIGILFRIDRPEMIRKRGGKTVAFVITSYQSFLSRTKHDVNVPDTVGESKAIPNQRFQHLPVEFRYSRAECNGNGMASGANKSRGVRKYALMKPFWMTTNNFAGDCESRGIEKKKNATIKIAQAICLLCAATLSRKICSLEKISLWMITDVKIHFRV